MSSPRPWRCFWNGQQHRKRDPGLLHVRGGVSVCNTSGGIEDSSSPRPWRCFFDAWLQNIAYGVFSTSVEVFLINSLYPGKVVSLLHVRGGVSTHLDRRFSHFESSPRPWRCFHVRVRSLGLLRVFSTSVEVFLHRGFGYGPRGRLLHVRGGVSRRLRCNAARSRSSPRPWRCFQMACRTARGHSVFSTSVEVFPTVFTDCASRSGLLHVRGGVSDCARCELTQWLSSPRPWRCFL